VEDLQKKDLIKLINFYKNKSSDLELEFLKLQINSELLLNQKLELLEQKLNKERQDQVSKLETKVAELQYALLKGVKSQNTKNIKNTNTASKKK
jgi:hypothetical protein